MFFDESVITDRLRASRNTFRRLRENPSSEYRLWEGAREGGKRLGLGWAVWEREELHSVILPSLLGGYVGILFF